MNEAKTTILMIGARIVGGKSLPAVSFVYSIHPPRTAYSRAPSAALRNAVLAEQPRYLGLHFLDIIFAQNLIQSVLYSLSFNGASA